MTKKRFKEIISTQKVIDNKTGKEYDCLLDNDLFDLINTIAEENEQLKQTSQDYEDIVNNWFIDNWDKLSDEMKQSAHLEVGIDIEYGGDYE